MPDIEKYCAHYLYYKDLDVLKSGFWGSQRHEFDLHKSGWDFETLKRDLSRFGFKNVKRYDWRKTEHFYIDDYSQAYWPHMDKENGMLLSLNVEATKGGIRIKFKGFYDEEEANFHVIGNKPFIPAGLRGKIKEDCGGSMCCMKNCVTCYPIMTSDDWTEEF